MRKIFLAVIFCILFFLPPRFVNAQVTEQRIFDEADLFTEAELEQLKTSVDTLRAKINMDVVIVTINDALGKTSREFADNYYDEHGFGVGNGASGVLFLIDMDNREIYISTTGKMINYLTDARIENILDMAYDGVSKGDYYSSAASFLEGIEMYYHAGIARGQYQYNEETGEIIPYRSLALWEIIAAITLSVGIGGAFYSIVVYKYRGRGSSYQFPVRQNSNVRLTNQQDIFINRTIRKVPISTDHGPRGGAGSGRSTTHRSGGGGMKGGGGRRF